MLAFAEHGVFGDGVIALAAQNQPDGRVVVGAAFVFFIHAHIHVHLAHVLVGELVHFKVDQQKAFEMKVVEHQIDEVVAVIGADALLAFDEGKALAQLQQELLQVGDDALFEVAFLPGFIRQVEKVEDVGVAQVMFGIILQRLGFLLCFLLDSGLVLAGEQALERRSATLQDEYERRVDELNDKSRRFRDSLNAKHREVLGQLQRARAEADAAKADARKAAKKLDAATDAIRKLQADVARSPTLQMEAQLEALATKVETLESEKAHVASAKKHYRTQWVKALKEIARLQDREKENALAGASAAASASSSPSPPPPPPPRLDVPSVVRDVFFPCRRLDELPDVDALPDAEPDRRSDDVLADVEPEPDENGSSVEKTTSHATLFGFEILICATACRPTMSAPNENVFDILA